MRASVFLIIFALIFTVVGVQAAPKDTLARPKPPPGINCANRPNHPHCQPTPTPTPSPVATPTPTPVATPTPSPTPVVSPTPVATPTPIPTPTPTPTPVATPTPTPSPTPSPTPIPTADFYIDPNGSDTAAGTEANPWRTLSKFYSVAQPGDTLFVRGGTYANTPSLNVFGKVGTAANPFTVQAYPGETPVFTGTDAFIYYDGGSAYHILDGLTIQRVVNNASTVIWIGNGASVPGPTNTHHITIRNSKISKMPGSTRNTAHGIYFSHMASNITISNNVITGIYSTEGQHNQAGLHWFHAPSTTATTINNNIVRNWGRGVLLWDEATPATITATFTHNTFQGNERHMDIRYHDDVIVRDNVGSNGNEAGSIGDLYDPFHSSLTTQDHNYWDQVLTPSGGLSAGSPAINGASDGSDAGAVPYP